MNKVAASPPRGTFGTAPVSSTLSIPMNGAGPYRMVLRGPGETRNFSLPFVLADVPLP
jgi:hypothetical protein